MTVLDLLFALCAAYVGAISAYLVYVTAGACLLRKRTKPDAAPLRLAVVIPAHNEALQIAACVRGIRACNYPPDRYTVMVLADNCDDNTAGAAKEAGAEVFERNALDLRGKGQALDWFIRNHEAMLAGFDGIALIDADTQVHFAFLREVSASLSHPEVQAVQGYHGISNPEGNWRSALTYAGFALINGLRPAGRCFWGGTADLKGNGMAFRTDLLLRYGWPAHSIVEDMEFSSRLLLDGIRVHFNPDAVVLSEAPTTQAQAEPQRRRWEAGRAALVRACVPAFIGAMVSKPRWAFLDAVLELLVPQLSIMVIAEGVLFVAALVLRPVWALYFAGCGICLFVYVVSGLYRMKAPASVWRGLFLTPLFLMWKIPFYLRLARTRKPRTWERTVRRAERERAEGAGAPGGKR